MSLSAGKVRTPFGASRAGAVTMLAMAVLALAACGRGPGTASSDVTSAGAVPAGRATPPGRAA